MAVKTFTITDTLLTSTWTAYSEYYGDGAFRYWISPNPPRTASSAKKYFGTAAIPNDSVINSATITATFNSPTTGVRVRQISIRDGAWTTFSGSVSAKTQLNAMNGTYVDLPVEFLFGAIGSSSGGTPSGVSRSSQLNITNIKLTVDYTEPKSGLTLNKSSCVAGQDIRCTIAPVSSTSAHKLKFAMSGVTTITTSTIPAGTKIYDFTPPISWLNAMPNNATRTVTVTLETYNGGTLTGSVDKTFTLTLPSDAYPSIGGVTATLVSNGVPAAITKYVQGKSQALIEVTGAAGVYGSTINSYKIEGGGGVVNAASGTLGPFLSSGEVVFTATITDSRGRTATATVSIIVDAYAPPTLDTPTAYRSTVGGVKSSAGQNLAVKSGIGFNSVSGENTATLEVCYGVKGGTLTAWAPLTPGALTILGSDSLLVTSSYEVHLRVTDTIGESQAFTAFISTAVAGLNLKKGVNTILGAGIGVYAERDSALTLKWPLWVLNDPVCKTEVGQLYISKDPTSPATKFPGTSWDALPEGTFIMAGGATHVPGEASGEGGSATHAHGLSGGYAMLSNAGKYQSKIGVNYNSNYQIANFSSTNTNSTATAGAQLGGSTDSGDSRPPFRAFYIWERTG